MDSDISSRSSDVLRNVVMGRVTDDGSYTEVGKLGDIKSAELLGATITKQIADEIYETHPKLLLPQIWDILDQLPPIKEPYICYANPDDYTVVEIIRMVYGTTSLRILNEVVYTNAVEKGKIYLVPARIIYQHLPLPLPSFVRPANTTIDELVTETQSEPPVRDISWIRKQMKHCKNPMERKALEKELNTAFKEKKRRRRKKDE